MAWVKFHDRLMKGPKRELARATRFVYLELALLSREESGTLRLPRTGKVAVAVRDLLGGRLAEIVTALHELEDAGMVRVVDNAEERCIVLPTWLEWNEPPGRSTERVRRKRERDAAGNADVTRYMSEGNARETLLEERREKREETPVGAPRPTVARHGAEELRTVPVAAPAPLRTNRINTGGAAFEVVLEAYVAGITSVTKTGLVLDTFAYRDLAAAVDAHAATVPLADLGAWVRSRAAAFATAAASGARIPSLKPRSFGEWLNAPDLATSMHGRRGKPRQGLPEGADLEAFDRAMESGETDGNKLLPLLGIGGTK